jgi:glycosyltransferase involved in cell wall biosynthesis
VINHHAGDLNEAAAALRRVGVKTATYLHLLDSTPSGRALGHPVLALAYEHAYDRVICVSRQMASWMHGAGVPADKLLLVRNAPGHDVAEDRREDILLRRAERRPERLQVLFLGRLDRQKGIDRLADVIDRSAADGLPLTWRVVGAPVTESAPLPAVIQALAEPPVYDSAGLVRLLDWADVMVLLSDYEGVPLSILEAQRLGVIVIATDVGAVSEIIESGRNGFLVDPISAVDETLGLLKSLAVDSALRATVAQAACLVPAWSETTAGLLEWTGLDAG